MRSRIFSGHIDMKIEQKLAKMNLQLPEAMELPDGVVLPFSFVRVRGNIAYISGHDHKILMAQSLNL